MFKAKDLRIGNKIQYHAEIGGVTKWWDYTVDVEDLAQLEKHPALWNEVHRPLRLTESLLIRSGSKKLPESEYTMDTYDFAGFKLWVKGNKFLFQDKIEIMYFHQLQNLYHSLTGKEI